MGRQFRRVLGRKFLVLAIAVGGPATVFGNSCAGELGTQFRAAAGDSIEQGVLSILTGVVQGVFAVVEPEQVAMN